MAEARFDELIHAPHRLRICATLAGAQEVEFSVLLDRLGLSKSALSKQVAQLVGEGYVAQEQRVRAGRSRQWLSLTPMGRRAYRGHVLALRALLEEPAGHSAP